MGRVRLSLVFRVDKGKARAIDPMDVDEKPILDSAQPRASTSAQPYSQSVEKQSGDDDIVLLDGPPTTKKVRKANDDKVKPVFAGGDFC